ncbi:MAG: VCBS repeat-containing protein [Bacteroidetes bacterium]|nr:VCBS repeat-containing protein [Fibrella sp.]
MKMLLVVCLLLTGLGQRSSDAPARFRRYFVAAESYESAAVFDVDKNGTPDIVSGDFWYEGPLFRKRHLIGNQRRQDQYYDDFSTIPLDINADGRTDVVTGGWWSGKLRWLENRTGSQPTGEWPVHDIATVGNIETTRAWDVDGDGTPELVPNNPGKSLKYFKLKNGAFQQIDVAPTQGHGLGFGDVNGDGKGDFVVSDGWLDAADNWTLHPEFSLGTAGVPVLVVDVNGDKKNDLIVGQGHGYGLHWYEQGIDRPTGRRTWTKHLIDDKNAQYHTMEWVDLTGDGKPELLTGKRFRAHDDRDPGSDDPVGLYYFAWDGKAFVRNTIAYGPAGEGKGTGIYMAVADLRGSGRTDIVVAGKDGLAVFFNEGR